MVEILTFSLLVFLGLVVIVIKMPRQLIRRALGYELVVDLVFFIVVKWLFFGSAIGMIIAFIAGLGFSCILHAFALFIGFERYDLVPCPHCGKASRAWTFHPPKYHFKVPQSTASTMPP